MPAPAGNYTVLMTETEMWDYLNDNCGVSEETLQVVTNLNGYRTDVLEDVLYVTTGYRTFDQHKEAGE